MPEPQPSDVPVWSLTQLYHSIGVFIVAVCAAIIPHAIANDWSVNVGIIILCSSAITALGILGFSVVGPNAARVR